MLCKYLYYEPLIHLGEQLWAVEDEQQGGSVGHPVINTNRRQSEGNSTRTQRQREGGCEAGRHTELVIPRGREAERETEIAVP